MYSFPNLEPAHCSMSVSNCYFLTCVQISQEAGKVIWYSRLLKNFPVIVTHKGFGTVNKAEVSLEVFCFFSDPIDVGNLISEGQESATESSNLQSLLVPLATHP